MDAMDYFDMVDLAFDIMDNRIPNWYDITNMYEKIVKPYNTLSLPNLRKIKNCFNCKYVDKMGCGSHIEWSCGISIDYFDKPDYVCDLHEWELSE